MGRTPKRLLGMAALLSILLLTPAFTDSAMAEDQQISGTVSAVQGYALIVDGVEYFVTATSRLEGVDHRNLEVLEGRQVQFTYTEFRGQKRVVELTVE